MRTHRWWIGLFALSFAAVLYACGGAQTPSGSASADTCPVLSAGPPPVCAEGCVWDGEVCRKHSGIIMPDYHGRDGGKQHPTSAEGSP